MDELYDLDFKNLQYISSDITSFDEIWDLGFITLIRYIECGLNEFNFEDMGLLDDFL